MTKTESSGRHERQKHLSHRRRGQSGQGAARRTAQCLNASPSALRRDGSGLWVLRGRPGCYVSTCGDGKSWQLVVAPEDEISALQWTWFKKRLAFAEVTQDGDQEGCFRLHRLPTSDQAEEIRDVIGIRKRVDYSSEELARRQKAGRRLNAGARDR